MQPHHASEAHVACRAEVHAAGQAIEYGLLGYKISHFIRKPSSSPTHKHGLPYEAVGFIREGIANEQNPRGGEAVTRGGQEAGQRLAYGVRIGHPILDQQSLAEHGQTQLHQLQESNSRHQEPEVDASADAAATDPDAQRLAHSSDSKGGSLHDV